MPVEDIDPNIEDDPEDIEIDHDEEEKLKSIEEDYEHQIEMVDLNAIPKIEAVESMMEKVDLNEALHEKADIGRVENAEKKVVNPMNDACIEVGSKLNDLTSKIDLFIAEQRDKYDLDSGKKDDGTTLGQLKAFYKRNEFAFRVAFGVAGPAIGIAIGYLIRYVSDVSGMKNDSSSSSKNTTVPAAQKELRLLKGGADTEEDVKNSIRSVIDAWWKMPESEWWRHFSECIKVVPKTTVLDQIVLLQIILQFCRQENMTWDSGDDKVDAATALINTFRSKSELGIISDLYLFANTVLYYGEPIPRCCMCQIFVLALFMMLQDKSHPIKVLVPDPAASKSVKAGSKNLFLKTIGHSEMAKLSARLAKPKSTTNILTSASAPNIAEGKVVAKVAKTEKTVESKSDSKSHAVDSKIQSAASQMIRPPSPLKTCERLIQSLIIIQMKMSSIDDGNQHLLFAAAATTVMNSLKTLSTATIDRGNRAIDAVCSGLLKLKRARIIMELKDPITADKPMGQYLLERFRSVIPKPLHEAKAESKSSQIDADLVIAQRFLRVVLGLKITEPRALAAFFGDLPDAHAGRTQDGSQRAISSSMTTTYLPASPVSTIIRAWRKMPEAVWWKYFSTLVRRNDYSIYEQVVYLQLIMLICHQRESFVFKQSADMTMYCNSILKAYHEYASDRNSIAELYAIAVTKVDLTYFGKRFPRSTMARVFIQSILLWRPHGFYPTRDKLSTNLNNHALVLRSPTTKFAKLFSRGLALSTTSYGATSTPTGTMWLQMASTVSFAFGTPGIFIAAALPILGFVFGIGGGSNSELLGLLGSMIGRLNRIEDALKNLYVQDQFKDIQTYIANAADDIQAIANKLSSSHDPSVIVDGITAERTGCIAQIDNFLSTEKGSLADCLLTLKHCLQNSTTQDHYMNQLDYNLDWARYITLVTGANVLICAMKYKLQCINYVSLNGTEEQKAQIASNVFNDTILNFSEFIAEYKDILAIPDPSVTSESDRMKTFFYQILKRRTSIDYQQNALRFSDLSIHHPDSSNVQFDRLRYSSAEFHWHNYPPNADCTNIALSTNAIDPDPSNAINDLNSFAISIHSAFPSEDARNGWVDWMRHWTNSVNVHAYSIVDRCIHKDGESMLIPDSGGFDILYCRYSRASPFGTDHIVEDAHCSFVYASNGSNCATLLELYNQRLLDSIHTIHQDVEHYKSSDDQFEQQVASIISALSAWNDCLDCLKNCPSEITPPSGLIQVDFSNANAAGSSSTWKDKAYVKYSVLYRNKVCTSKSACLSDWTAINGKEYAKITIPMPATNCQVGQIVISRQFGKVDTANSTKDNPVIMKDGRFKQLSVVTLSVVECSASTYVFQDEMKYEQL